MLRARKNKVLAHNVFFPQLNTIQLNERLGVYLKAYQQRNEDSNARSLNRVRQIQVNTKQQRVLVIENPKGNIDYTVYATESLRQHYPQATVYQHAMTRCSMPCRITTSFSFIATTKPTQSNHCKACWKKLISKRV